MSADAGPDSILFDPKQQVASPIPVGGAFLRSAEEHVGYSPVTILVLAKAPRWHTKMMCYTYVIHSTRRPQASSRKMSVIPPK